MRPDAARRRGPPAALLPARRGAALNDSFTTPSPLQLTGRLRRHYCQRYEHVEKPPYDESNWIYSKYQVPDEILHCPAGTHDLEGERPKKKAARQRMRLDADGFLPEPSATVDAAVLTGTSGRARLRHVWAFCAATRRTNLAARDYRRWFCAKN